MDELEEQLRVWRPGIDKLAEDEVSQTTHARAVIEEKCLSDLPELSVVLALPHRYLTTTAAPTKLFIE